ncbi:uncharacterized protein LOC112562569 isoform X2 [Pomacea canaliculata]|uniref:uncharacterized protein LOC112562569 isoform X2 n=1 Tax=Pomacea canaliculata TaxID=400727 RepID=UPI000D73FF78|nr:uncharacterized protein LOC112562569 isoform X2 [Pomacea canaliculata]
MTRLFRLHSTIISRQQPHHLGAAMALRLLLLFFIYGFSVTSLKGMFVNPSQAEDTGTRLHKCKGSNLILNEPNPQVTVLDAFVFHGENSLASISVPATGMFEGRLVVGHDGSVTLNNITSDDLGRYQVEIHLAEKKLINTIRLVIKESPETADAKLFVMKNELPESSSFRLTCGTFTTLGFPPVSAVWTDPAGRTLSSHGFEDEYFYLDVPADTADPGEYSCHLDCRAPDFCCLDDQSPLRSRAHLQVHTQKKVEVMSMQSVAFHTFSQLQQQASEFTRNVRNFQELGWSQNAVAATAHLANVQSKSDTGLNKVENLDNELKRILENARNLIFKTDTWMSAFEEKFSAMEGKFMSQVDNVSQIVDRIRSRQVRKDEHRCLQKDGYMWHLESCLKVSTYEANYVAAKAACRKDGAHLFDLKLPDLDVERLRMAVIESKNNGTSIRGYYYFMVGANDIASNHTFVWTDGTPLPLSSPLWGPKQPNPGKDEDCIWAHIDLPQVSLHDFSCDTQAYFICQYDI